MQALRENGLDETTVVIFVSDNENRAMTMTLPSQVTEGQGTINVRANGEIAIQHGETVYLSPDQSKLHRFSADGRAM